MTRTKEGAGATPYFQQTAVDGFQSGVKGIGEFQFSAETNHTTSEKLSRFSGEFRAQKSI